MPTFWQYFFDSVARNQIKTECLCGRLPTCKSQIYKKEARHSKVSFRLHKKTLHTQRQNEGLLTISKSSFLTENLRVLAAHRHHPKEAPGNDRGRVIAD